MLGNMSKISGVNVLGLPIIGGSFWRRTLKLATVPTISSTAYRNCGYKIEFEAIEDM